MMENALLYIVIVMHVMAGHFSSLLFFNAHDACIALLLLLSIFWRLAAAV
jgi:hypothetical protein